MLKALSNVATSKIRSPLGGLAVAFRSLQEKQFRRFTIASLISNIGGWMQLIAQNWLVLDFTGSGALLGALVSVQSIATLAMSVGGGVIADRFSRKRILLATQITFATLAAVQAALVATGSMQVWMLFALAAVTGATSAVDGPAGSALGADIVTPKHLANAIALGSVSHSLGRLIGIATAGLVLGFAGVAGAFAVNALSFVPLMFVIGGVKIVNKVREAKVETGKMHEVVDVVKTQKLLVLMAVVFVFSSLGRNYQVTMALMVQRVFHAGPETYGTVSAAFAFGAIAGGLIAARLRDVNRKTMLIACAVAAALQLVSGFAPNAGLFTAVMIPIAAAAVIIDTATQTITQLATAQHVRGRIAAAMTMVSSLAAAVGGWLLGAISDLSGPRASLIVGGAVCLASILLVGRKLTANHDAEADIVIEAEEIILDATPAAIRKPVDATARFGLSPEHFDDTVDARN